MIAIELNIGVNNNVVTIALALITLFTLVVNTRTSQKGAKAAEAAAGQLTNNGGSTALDKLEKGHKLILARLDDIDSRLDSHDEQLVRIRKEAA